MDVAHTTIMRWVQRYVAEFEKRWQRYARLGLRGELMRPISKSKASGFIYITLWTALDSPSTSS